jgi:SAM-dependent methyltransferase
MTQSAADPLQLLFHDLDKLGPGDDAETERLLGVLPEGAYRQVVDAGCGRGRQTLVLARALDTVVDAVDLHQPFLDDLERLASARGLADRVRTHCMDMASLGERFRDLDLIWSEGAAYAIGFATAMRQWAPVLRGGGCLVVSDCCWLGPQPPDPVRTFWEKAYPTMASLERNIGFARAAGLELLESSVLPDEAWTRGYYDRLEPRARELLESAGEDAAVRALAEGTLEEIAAHNAAGGSVGYVFFVLRRPR